MKREMNGRQIAATWLVAQCEPLVPTLDRAVAEAAFVEMTARDLSWARWWFAGVISDHLLTLPPADPWRHLSARVGSRLSRGRLPKPPEVTGAVGANGPFGTLEDGLDIVHASFADAPTDIGLAALSSGLSPGGGVLLAFAADGWEPAARAGQSLHVEHLAEAGNPAKAAGLWFGDASGALRWAAWRRRAYLGGDDWTLASGFNWMWRADELSTVGRLPDGEKETILAQVDAERIDPGTYTLLADLHR
jgi:hypothetical protein